MGSRWRWLVPVAPGCIILTSTTPGVVVLDVGLPDLDGWQVLQRIRESSAVPVLMLTGHADEPDKVRGLRGGADDYLTKPFGIDEFAARVDALLRRGLRQPHPTADVFVDGDLYVDFDRREVRVAGEEVGSHTHRVQAAGGSGAPCRPGDVRPTSSFGWHGTTAPASASDRVKFSVHRLRRKLGWEDLESSPIEAVRGVGYRYRPVEPATSAHLAEPVIAAEPGTSAGPGPSGTSIGPRLPPAGARARTRCPRSMGRLARLEFRVDPGGLSQPNCNQPRPRKSSRYGKLDDMGMPGTTRPTKILVVEDDPAIARVLFRLLIAGGARSFGPLTAPRESASSTTSRRTWWCWTWGFRDSTAGRCSATSGPQARCRSSS